MTLLVTSPLTFEEYDTPSDTRERRRGLRVRQHRPVKVYDTASTRYMGGQSEDISTTGMRLELPISAPVMPGKVVMVHVGTSDQGSSLVNRRRMMPARVVWINRSPNAAEGKMMAGIEFLASIAAHRDAA